MIEGCLNVSHNDVDCVHAGSWPLTRWCDPCLAGRVEQLSSDITAFNAKGAVLNRRYDRAPDGSEEKMKAVSELGANGDHLRHAWSEVNRVLEEQDRRENSSPSSSNKTLGKR